MIRCTRPLFYDLNWAEKGTQYGIVRYLYSLPNLAAVLLVLCVVRESVRYRLVPTIELVGIAHPRILHSIAYNVQ